MSAYYDLFEKPDVRQTGEQQSLYARFVPKGTIDRKEFIERVHLFTGLSRSLLEGAMAGFMDELRDCLANGWTVELGELGYFTPSLSCTRQATDKKELRAASIALRGLNFRLGREFYKDLKGKMQLERCPQSACLLRLPMRRWAWSSAGSCWMSICSSIPASIAPSMHGWQDVVISRRLSI